MILTDWLMVGVTKMVYSCKVAYRQGMLFGVHVPGDAAELQVPGQEDALILGLPEIEATAGSEDDD